jgi:hypothetical protein
MPDKKTTTKQNTSSTKKSNNKKDNTIVKKSTATVSTKNTTKKISLPKLPLNLKKFSFSSLPFLYQTSVLVILMSLIILFYTFFGASVFNLSDTKTGFSKNVSSSKTYDNNTNTTSAQNNKPSSYPSYNTYKNSPYKSTNDNSYSQTTQDFLAAPKRQITQYLSIPTNTNKRINNRNQLPYAPNHNPNSKRTPLTKSPSFYRPFHPPYKTYYYPPTYGYPNPYYPRPNHYARPY